MKKVLKVVLWVVGSLVVLMIGLIVLAATVMPAADPKQAEPVAAASTTPAPATVEPTQAPTTVQAPATTQPAPQPTVAPATVAPAAPTKTFVDQIREDVGSYANLVTSAEQTEPDRIEVGTSIVDPRGENGSAPARQALGICQRIRNKHPEAQHITIYEQDGTTFVLYGHPAYGNTCTEI